jgi:hypothetical protein
MLNRIDGDRPAEQRSPVDAREHDDRRGRRHRERQRQQDRDAVGAAEARQHADQHAEQDADQHEQQVLPRQGDAKPCIRLPMSSTERIPYSWF